MTPISLGIFASANQSAAATSFESIATSNPSGASDITFSSIAGTWQHLQIRYSITGSSAGTGLRIQFNSDTASNYFRHTLSGDGSSASSSAAPAAEASGLIGGIPGSTSYYSAGVVDILDYTSTSKNKTVRTLFGIDENGSGFIRLFSSLWFKTPEAITAIKIFPSSGTITGTIALYGIKSA